MNSPEITRYIEKQVVLQTLDHLWREHLVVLDHLRQVIGWRGMAQRDPLNEYKSEAFELFDALITRLREVVTAQLMRVEVAHERPAEPQLPPMQAMHVDPLTGEDELALAQINARIAAGDFTPRALGATEADAGARLRTIRRPGAGSAATRPAPAARARNTSIATAWRRKAFSQDACARLRTASRLLSEAEQ